LGGLGSEQRQRSPPIHSLPLAYATLLSPNPHKCGARRLAIICARGNADESPVKTL